MRTTSEEKVLRLDPKMTNGAGLPDMQRGESTDAEGCLSTLPEIRSRAV